MAMFIKHLTRAGATLAALTLAAGPALAGPVTLRAEPVDDNGRITLGELFDGAGAAADIVVGTRTGPTAVLDAGRLQSLARNAGLQWANSTGLRRIVVRQGAPSQAPAAAGAAQPAASAAETVEVLTYARSLMSGEVIGPQDLIWAPVQAHRAPSGSPDDAAEVIGLEARRPLRAGAPVSSRDLTSPQVIARNDMIEVEFVSGGVRLTLTARAQRDAALGEAFPVLNVQSGRTIQVVAAGRGRALAGPAARTASPSDFAALR